MFDGKLLVHLWLISILLIGQANCSAFAQTRKVKFGETFTLKLDETVETEDGKFKVQLKGVGRTISGSGEVEYAELRVWFNKLGQLITISERKNASKIVGNYIVKLVNAES